MFARWLHDHSIHLDIKRGERVTLRQGFKRIRNDELGQVLLSFVYQQPGTARSGKRALFDNEEIYNKVFRNRYERDLDKKQFIIDLIDLNERYTLTTANLMESESSIFTTDNKIVLKNAKQAMFALMGLFYKLKNGDISSTEIINDPLELSSSEFIYSSFIGGYINDDIDEQLERMIRSLTLLLTEIYDQQLRSNQVTSVSNMFKSDKRYQEIIVPLLIQRLTTSLGREIDEASVILRRR
ncbi:MAG: hypothetical protein WC233_06740 [Sphaerochaeta sp.]